MQEPENPYTPPVTADPNLVAEVLETGIPQTASLGLRFANLIVDRIAVVGLVFGVSFAIGMFGGMSGVDWVEGAGQYIIGFGTTILYYAACESVFGRTLGKLVTGTKVIGEHGGKPSFGKALLRTLCRFIPFEPFSFFGSERRGWHDSITRTWVIRSRN